MNRNLSKIVEADKNTSSKLRQAQRQGQANLNERLDNLYFLEIGGGHYDSLLNKSNNCIYVVNRNGSVELYKGSKRIIVGSGVTINHAIALKMSEEVP